MKRSVNLLIACIGGLFVAGCATPVFNAPVTVSTRSCVSEHFTPVKQVSVTKTNYLFVLIPIVCDPRDGFDDLLQAAKSAGGDSVIDVQVRTASSFMWVIPGIVVANIDYTGLAVRTKP
jgi:hypothetical protein